MSVAVALALSSVGAEALVGYALGVVETGCTAVAADAATGTGQLKIVSGRNPFLAQWTC